MTEVVAGDGGLPKVVLRSRDGATADIYLLGAHVTSWRPATDGAERLFLSARSEFRDGVAIRGGIPVIFPQFAAEGPLPRHGFARTSRWALTESDEERAGESDVSATFVLEDSTDTRASWPRAFRATLHVRLGADRLTVTLGVENREDAALSFTCALHTYLRLGDGSADLVGLHGYRYRESSAPDLLVFDPSESLDVRGEMDRVYVDAPARLTLREDARAMTIEKSGFPDVVVWNPGEVRARTLADMEPGGEKRMFCVEAGAIQTPVTLDAGAQWRASQSLTAVERVL